MLNSCAGRDAYFFQNTRGGASQIELMFLVTLFHEITHRLLGSRTWGHIHTPPELGSGFSELDDSTRALNDNAGVADPRRGSRLSGPGHGESGRQVEEQLFGGVVDLNLDEDPPRSIWRSGAVNVHCQWMRIM